MKSTYSSILLFGTLILIGCKEEVQKEIINESKPALPIECQIISVKDSACDYSWFAKQFNFNCGSTLKHYNFRDNNPWKDITYPRITEANQFLSFSDQTPRHIKAGSFYFDLNYDSFEKIKLKIPNAYPSWIKDYFFRLARTSTHYINYSPNYALIYYNLTLTGLTDTTVKSDLAPVFYASQMSVLNQSGEVIYRHTGKNYLLYGAAIDINSNLLWFVTHEIFNKKDRSGIQIHDLKLDTTIFVTIVDTSKYISLPIVYPDYVVFEVLRKPECQYLSEIIVLDITKRKMRKIILKKNYFFTNPFIVNREIILSQGDDENEPIIYDTIAINSIDLLN